MSEPLRRTRRGTPSSGARGVWRALGTGISAGLLLLVVAVACAVVVVPWATRSVPLTVLTTSMEPTYPVGTLVVVSPVAAADIRMGDVVTYQLTSGDPTLVTHRVVAITQSTAGAFTFTTKGDNNATADAAPVTEPQVQGRVWYSVPWVGVLNNAAGGAQSWLVIAFAVVLFVYAGWMLAGGALADRARRARARASTEGDEPAPVAVRART